jgi:two-component system response regulator PilR (NtrC family)
VHCELTATDAGLSVRDSGSKNGLFLGEGRVDSAFLAGPRASFSIGHTTVVVEPRRRRDRVEDDLGLVGDSDPIRRLRQTIERFARLKGPVLITGESGTGKDLVAGLLHRLSGRRGAYVPLNVAALSDNLIDAELFGHVRGAFTGADTSRPGAFVQADGGSLFLDEIADLALPGQSKLLRVVEDRMVRPVGGTHARSVDVRLISATCAPLTERMEQERFRPDLYHRLSTLVLQVPPLRERRGDIPLLVDALLGKMATEVGPRRVHPAALDALCQYSWPGNVRQLFQVLYRAAASFPGTLIEPGHLEVERDRPRRKRSLDFDSAQELLARHPTVSAAARAAGVPRTTFRSVLERGARSK